MTLGRAAASALLLLAVGRAEAAAQQSLPLADWSIEREERTLDVPPGGRIEIANLFGDVRVRAGEAGRVEIWAVFQRHLKDPRRLALAVTSGANATSIGLSSASALLRYVRRGSVQRVATLQANDAEVLSLVVTAGSPLVGRALADVEFPEGAIVGAILRGNHVVVPTGRDSLRVGDGAIVFALPGAVKPVTQLFPA